MLTLRQLLHALPYSDLRGVATRLGLRRAGQHDKPTWVAAIAQGWADPAQAATWLAHLSPTAQTALARLLGLERCPAQPWRAEFGRIRQVTTGQKFTPPPWAAPATVSEELYYLGLLHPADGQALRRTEAFALPTDLRSALADLLPTPSNPHPLPPPSPDAGWALVHDLARLLIFLHQQWVLGGAPRRQPGRLHGGHWLTLTQRRALNPHLLRPAPTPLPASNRQHGWLCTLLFLSEAAGLQVAGVLTATGWAWLQAPPLEQVRQVWAAWPGAAPALWTRYLPGASLPPPWPHPLLPRLAGLQTPFTLADLAAKVLGAHEFSPSYWAAHLPTLQALDDALGALWTALLLPLGVVGVAAIDDATPHYVLTALGRWLLHGEEPPPAPVAAPATWQDAWQVVVPTWAARHAQATLAAYADDAGGTDAATTPTAGYALSPTSLGRAAALGLGLPTLLAALGALGLPLDPARSATLHEWWDSGAALQIGASLWLRTRDAAQLAALLAAPSLQPLWGEPLAPNLVTLRVSAPTARRALQAAGHFPTLHAVADEGSSQTSTAAETAALWLAGRLYAVLGQHLPLPVPPPFAELDRLLATLSPAEQAVVQAQAADLQERLLDLLDNLPFTPPPQPSNPLQWQERINAAIDHKQRLWLTYFSAGRNLTTRRLVEPHWVEERRGVPYLRAYCHSAGRVLTFRLDRIQEMEGEGVKG